MSILDTEDEENIPSLGDTDGSVREADPGISTKGEAQEERRKEGRRATDQPVALPDDAPSTGTVDGLSTEPPSFPGGVLVDSPIEQLTLEQKLLSSLRGKRVIESPSKAGGNYYRSRLVLEPDGNTEPLLSLMASLKFPGWDRKVLRAYWVDANPTNETFSNVGLATIPGRVKPGRARGNQYGAPSGSKEYWKKYREQNKDKLSAYYKTRRAVNRIERERYREIMSGRTVAGTPERIEAVQESRLDDIFQMVKEEKAKP
jgi:hypothetical protein